MNNTKVEQWEMPKEQLLDWKLRKMLSHTSCMLSMMLVLSRMSFV